MGKRLSPAELEERAKLARAREAAMKARRTANPKPYTPRTAEDFSTIFYRDPLETGRFLEIDVKARALTKIGGVAAAGLLATLPDGSVAVKITRGSKIPIVKLRWYFGDANASPVMTPWGTRWIKKYDADGGQSHYTLPFSIATGVFTLDTIQTKFREYFNETNGTKRTEMLGANGSIELVMGYGNQYTVLSRY
jgi:hypothetical protein